MTFKYEYLNIYYSEVHAWNNSIIMVLFYTLNTSGYIFNVVSLIIIIAIQII